MAINIAEAVLRDFQCFSYNGFVDGMQIIGGPWNIINGIAGILNILTICGWASIYGLKNKSKDLIWPDMMWFWIIAYDLWNFSYLYNCVPTHSFYSGIALLLSCTIPAFFIQKGAWLQHRAYTLALWMIFIMTFSKFIDFSVITVQSSYNPNVMLLISSVSLVANIGVFVYHYYRVIKYKRNPLREAVYR